MDDRTEKVLRRRQLLSGEEGAEGMFGQCPECSYETYVMSGEEAGCAWCQLELDECLRCSETLTPNNVSWNSNELCSYRDHVMSTDD